MALIDKSNMRKIILEFPKQFQIGLKAAKNIKVSGKFDAVSICGMGGSALPGDVLKMWLKAYKIALPLEIRRSYDLPYQVDNKYLIICISYSGNTEETLFNFEEALRKKLKVIVITTGGKLGKICKEKQIPAVIVPKGIPPRLALGCQFAALMQVLVNCGIIRDNLENILALEKNLKPINLEIQGKNLAKKLKNPIRKSSISNGASKIPIIYASERLAPLAYVWKIKFNENSKIPAFYNYFPELNHNEITGFENPQAKFHLIVLQDPADHPRILKRMKLTADLLRPRKVSVDFIDLAGRDILYKIFSNILLADWVSYYLALEYRIDPTPVKLQEEFKKRIGKFK